jgi:TonB family protein
MQRRRVPIAALTLLCLFGVSAGRPDTQGQDRFAYHLRVVRIAGADAHRGAALACGSSCGTPIVLPTEEAWGTPEQLAGLARALGGDRADAVTGFIVLPEQDGEARFLATIYPGEVALGLRLEAHALEPPETRHDLVLELSADASDPPLAEVHLLAAPERTVAIAIPSPVATEWVVLAITTLDRHAAEERASKGAPIASADGSITPPELVEKVSPDYPPQARTEQREGRVMLEAVIDVAGSVRALTVLQVPRGSEDFAASAVEAVERWRYRPARASDGTPVPVYFHVAVEFRLR